MGLTRRSMLAAAVGAFASPATAAPPVDLALVLAIDVSYSVDAFEYQLQMRGTGQAFLNPQIAEAVARGANKRIAVSAFLWSDPDQQIVLVPWHLFAKPADGAAIAERFLRAPRDVPRGATGTGPAMLFGQSLLDSAPPAFRRVIDVSTDGRANVGAKTQPTRDQLVQAGITINGLAILNEVQNLDVYMKREVIGGDGSFVVVANDYNAYAEAIRAKLYREILNTNLS